MLASLQSRLYDLVRRDTFLPRFHFLAIGLLGIMLLLLPQLTGLVLVGLFTRIFVLAVFGMSYDLLRGYAGIINLGHALFFGGGTYIAGIVFANYGTSPTMLGLAVLGTTAYAMLAALLMGKIAFRRGNVVACAMITLALGEIVRQIAESWRAVTHGADGLTFPIPMMFRDRVALYYYALAFMVIMMLALRQFIMSPTGRVLLAIRENEQRAIFLGYNTASYKLVALQVAGVVCGWSGVMFALTSRFANTELLTVQQTLNALLVTIVGGTGTLYGAIVGTAFVQLAQHTLLGLRGVHLIFERWLLFFGAIYVFVVLFMPTGIVGLYQRLISHWLKPVKPR
ncbi:MAG: branched-chain amino acid ABC transporter permease [Peptococcaceae bacterium]|nr:branched-chain amino acid ABC transporter permease [Peptococcaceae bacterium]